MNWQGLGVVIATGMTALADRLVSGFGQILGPLLAMRQRPVQAIALTEQMTLREVSISYAAVGKGLDADAWHLNSPQRIVTRVERLPLPSQSVVSLTAPSTSPSPLPILPSVQKFAPIALLQPVGGGSRGGISPGVMAPALQTTLAKALPVWSLAPLALPGGNGQVLPSPPALGALGGTTQPLTLPQIVTQPQPTPGPTLAQLPQRSVAQPLPPPRPQPVPEAATPVTPLTFNGGIHVQIAAATIDRGHAQETARMIAGHVLTEINRITDRDRFRRGLPPLSTR
jgi:hypothetical protein